MNKHKRILRNHIGNWLAAALLLSGIGGVTSAFAEDIKGSKDHPLVSRYEGSDIFIYKADAFNEYPLFINEISTHKGIEGQPDSVMWLEGRLTRLLYVYMSIHQNDLPWRY